MRRYDRPAPPCWLAAVFILAALPTLMWLALFVPAGEVPDEVAHLLRADSVRRGELAGFRQAVADEQGPFTDVAVIADPGLLSAGFSFTPGVPLVEKHVTLDWLAKRQQLAWEYHTRPVSVPNTGIYPPTLYVPAAAALQVAEWAGHGPYLGIIAARLANAALYLLLGAFAIGLARRGQAILLAILCLPMSLSLAASVNQDGLVLACAALSAALLTRHTTRAWWGGAVLFAIAAMAKPYLLPLALLILVTTPAADRRRPMVRALAGFALATLPAFVWAAAMAAFVAEPLGRDPAQPPGPLWPGPPGVLFDAADPGAQLHVLLADPRHLITLPLDSITDRAYWLWREALGVLGTLDLVLPEPLYTAWAIALAAALLAGCFASDRRGIGTRPAEALAALAGGIGAIWLAYIMQYLKWTHVGAALVDGVQGRYVLPIAALALPLATLPALIVPALRVLLSLPTALLALASVAILPLIVLQAYFVR